MFRKSDTHIHFVGIGGIGMSGIAEVLLNLGYRVTGTDLHRSAATERLERLGATVHEGHDPGHLGDADVVVTSSAVGRDNPEVVAARQRKIPVIPRAEMLAELMRLKQGIAIAGSHGKTTTTSMIAAILHAAEVDPTVIIGGIVNHLASNARVGQGPVLVAEADESDGSFLLLGPTFAVITNVDAEHLEHYGELPQLIDAFVGFANRVPFYGSAVLCLDDPNLAQAWPRFTKRTVTYGIERTDADYVATQIVSKGTTTHVRVLHRGQTAGNLTLPVPGRHNVLNALAAFAVADEVGVPRATTEAGLAAFTGVQRRFTIRGEAHDRLVIDDYGHHPTEIRATLEAARTSYPGRRIVAAVQPHRFTRLRDNWQGFLDCLRLADAVLVTDVYAAGEAPLPGITAQGLADALAQERPQCDVVYCSDFARIAERLAALSRPGDLILTLGAGNITTVAEPLLAALTPSKSTHHERD